MTAKISKKISNIFGNAVEPSVVSINSGTYLGRPTKTHSLVNISLVILTAVIMLVTFGIPAWLAAVSVIKLGHVYLPSYVNDPWFLRQMVHGTR